MMQLDSIDFEKTLWHLPSGVILLDPKGFVIYSNLYAQNLIDESIKGKSWSFCIKNIFSPQKDDGHEISLRNGKRVTIQTQALYHNKGQVIVVQDLTHSRTHQEWVAKQEKIQAMVEMASNFAQHLQSKNEKKIIFEDQVTHQIMLLAKKIAQTDATVLLTGESGVGKEVFARYVHEESKRSQFPFVAINCAAIPETMLEAILFGYEKGSFTGANQSTPGKFEQAHQGTLLLDEITEIPLALQAKLLRVLQEKEVERLGSRKTIPLDVRIIATSNRNLQTEVSSGNFREDLFYRIQVFQIEIPPLRERRKDIVPIAEFFLKKYADRFDVDLPELLDCSKEILRQYSWPGNVRELENVIQRALILKKNKNIEKSDLPLGEIEQEKKTVNKNTGPLPLNDQMKNQEHVMILSVLESHNGSRIQTAKALGISERTLRYKLSKMREDGLIS